MSRKKQSKKSPCQSKRRQQRRREQVRRKNSTAFLELLKWFVLVDELFTEDTFHGNTKWQPEQVAAQAVIWSWQETKNVTDAFEESMEICQDLGMQRTSRSSLLVCGITIKGWPKTWGESSSAPTVGC